MQQALFLTKGGKGMQTPEHYETDLLFYFGEKEEEYRLYRRFAERLAKTVPPEVTVKVQKSQISFYGKHLFAAASLPVRRKKDWPEHCLLVTFGLPARLEDPGIAVAVEPYPNRWTHHVVVSREEQLDEDLFAWIGAAYAFSQPKQ